MNQVDITASQRHHKAFTLNFLEANPSIDMQDGWIWSPESDISDLDIKTATFSGKNKADDYTNE